MNLFVFAFVLSGFFFANDSFAAGGMPAHFVCDGSSSNKIFSIIQHKVDGKFGPMVIIENGQAKTIETMGLNTFPIGALIGETLYGVPPFADVRVELIREIDKSEYFSIKLYDRIRVAPASLECRLL